MGYKDKAVQREYQRKWIARRKQEWMDENGPCILCGSWESLELDHEDPSKKWTHRVWSYSETKRNAELAKCRPLCSLCHKDKTARESPKGEAVGNSKLTEETVLEIRQLADTGKYSKRELGRLFGTDEKNIRLILKREAWQHI